MNSATDSAAKPDGDACLVPDWSLPKGVRAAVSTRQAPGASTGAFARCNLGINSGDDAGAVRHNRQVLQQALALPQPPHWLRQVHGTTVIHADAYTPDAEPQADAAVTRHPGIALAILTADCLPVLLCADDGSEIAAAHAGWRGLAGGVIEAAVAAMQTPAVHIRAWLGPCIGPASYEVDATVRDAFAGDAAFEEAFHATRPGHWQADLAQLARYRLQQAGVGRIDGGGFDTATDPRFYSYRRDGAASGRFASLIWRHA